MNLEEIAQAARDYFVDKHQAREEGLRLSREVIRFSANAIRAVHRLEFDAAQELLGQARAEVVQAQKALAAHPDTYYAGFLQDSQKEYAEASITLSLVSGLGLPHPEAVGVGYPSYLRGLGEAMGELRRFILDSLRRDDTSRCEDLLDTMDAVYSVLVTMDFPEGVTGGLRHTTDQVRGTLERTRGDLTLALRQRSLEMRLKKFEGGV